jgi:hypothetical protein
MKTRHLTVLFAVILAMMVVPATRLLALVIPGGLIRESMMTPGAAASGKIMLNNNSDKPQTVKIYQGDYMAYADGRREFARGSSGNRSNAAWIKFSPEMITIAAGQTGYVDYQIRVPDDKNLCGTYWSVLMIEPIADSSPELAGNSKKPQLGVQTIVRYALQIITNFEKDSEKALKFIDKRLEINEKGKFFQIDLENSGNRLVEAKVWIEVYDTTGSSLGRFEAAGQRLFPGCSARYRTDLGQLPAGSYTSLLIADIGNDKVFGAKYRLEIP